MYGLGPGSDLIGFSLRDRHPSRWLVQIMCQTTILIRLGNVWFCLVSLTASETQTGCSIATSDTYFTIFALSHHGNEHRMSTFGNHNIQEPLSWIQRLVQQLVPRWRQIAEFLNGQGWNIESKTTEQSAMTNQQSWSFVCFDVMLTVCIAFCFETLVLVFAFPVPWGHVAGMWPAKWLYHHFLGR